MPSDLEIFSYERPKPLPEYPKRYGLLEDWTESVLVMLTRILEVHQGNLGDEELILAQNTIERVRQLFTMSVGYEDIMEKYIELEKELVHTEAVAHLQEHMLAAVAKRDSGALLLSNDEIESIDCDDYLKQDFTLSDETGGMVFYLQPVFASREAAEAWAASELLKRKV